MRIATPAAVLLAATLLPALPATAQNADDIPSARGIHTSQFQQFGPFRTAHRTGRGTRGTSGASASRACLSGDTRALLSRFEARFGTVKVISTCRPGAVIAGSGRPSQHRYGKAVDFMPKPGQRAAMLAWLRSHANGAVITYGSGHIHFDTGGYRNFAVSAKARRAQARAR